MLKDTTQCLWCHESKFKTISPILEFNDAKQGAAKPRILFDRKSQDNSVFKCGIAYIRALFEWIFRILSAATIEDNILQCPCLGLTSKCPRYVILSF